MARLLWRVRSGKEKIKKNIPRPWVRTRTTGTSGVVFLGRNKIKSNKTLLLGYNFFFLTLTAFTVYFIADSGNRIVLTPSRQPRSFPALTTGFYFVK